MFLCTLSQKLREEAILKVCNVVFLFDLTKKCLNVSIWKFSKTWYLIPFWCALLKSKHAAACFYLLDGSFKIDAWTNSSFASCYIAARTLYLFDGSFKIDAWRNTNGINAQFIFMQ